MGLFSRKPKQEAEPTPEPSFHLKLNELGIEFPVNLETFTLQPLSLDNELGFVEGFYKKENYSDFFKVGLYYKYSEAKDVNSYSTFLFGLFNFYTEENEREVVKFINEFHKIYGMDELAFKTEFTSEDLEQLRGDELHIFRIFKQITSKEKTGIGSMTRLNQIMVSIGEGQLVLSISSPVEFEDL
jgi:hypothetical protein